MWGDVLLLISLIFEREIPLATLYSLELDKANVKYPRNHMLNVFSLHGLDERLVFYIDQTSSGKIA